MSELYQLPDIPDDTFVGFSPNQTLSSLIAQLQTPEVSPIAALQNTINQYSGLSDIINTGAYARPTTNLPYLDLALNMAQGAAYSQAKRTLPNFYDCSSFIGRVLNRAGYQIDPAVTTANIPSALATAGFIQRPLRSVAELMPGDILWRNGHAEFYLGNGQSVGAHNSTTGVGTTTAFGNNTNPYKYTHYFRYG